MCSASSRERPPSSCCSSTVPGCASRSAWGSESRHLECVRRTHRRDLEAGYGRTSLPYALARKYPKAPDEWPWQYVFPASQRVRQADGEEVRHHLHPTAVQRAVRHAVRRSGITKRATTKVGWACRARRTAFDVCGRDGGRGAGRIRLRAAATSSSTGGRSPGPATPHSPGGRSPPSSTGAAQIGCTPRQPIHQATNSGRLLDCLSRSPSHPA